AGGHRRAQSDDLCGRRHARHPHRVQPIRSYAGLYRGRRTGREPLRARHVAIQEDLMARDAASRPADRKRHWPFDFAPLAACFALLISLGFLPPDTSSAEVDATGRLSVCMPSNYPPLVTGNAEAPGFEVELVNEIADRLGWRLNIVTNAAMGRDFNPRNWRINRAQCQMLAGGIVMSATTQSFLDTTRPHLQTGWALISRSDAALADIDGQIGFYAGLTGLDRIGLGQYLRQS